MGTSLDLLGHLHVLLPLRCVRAPGRTCCCYSPGAGPSHQGQNPAGPGVDCCQLVHIPSCLPLPNGWPWWMPLCCQHSGWLLHFRHHLQVRCRPAHLPDLLREVQARDCQAADEVRDCKGWRQGYGELPERTRPPCLSIAVMAAMMTKRCHSQFGLLALRIHLHACAMTSFRGDAKLQLAWPLIL